MHTLQKPDPVLPVMLNIINLVSEFPFQILELKDVKLAMGIGTILPTAKLETVELEIIVTVKSCPKCDGTL